MVTVSPLEVFAGPVAALLIIIFLSIVVIAVYNFRFFKGFSLFMFLRLHSILKVYFIFKSINIFKFLFRKKYSIKL